MDPVDRIDSLLGSCEVGKIRITSLAEYSLSDSMPASTRLKYTDSRGDGSQDVDDWFAQLESISVANQEDLESKRRVFQGMLKGEALK